MAAAFERSRFSEWLFFANASRRSAGGTPTRVSPIFFARYLSVFPWWAKRVTWKTARNCSSTRATIVPVNNGRSRPLFSLSDRQMARPGNFVCMDVSGNSLTLNTPVIAYDCHAGPSQQFQFAGPDPQLPGTVAAPPVEAIVRGEWAQMFDRPRRATNSPILVSEVRVEHWRALLRGLTVVSGSCDRVSTTFQPFSYIGGNIRLLLNTPLQFPLNNPPLCLDAGNMENGTQLVINNCGDIGGRPNFQWQIEFEKRTGPRGARGALRRDLSNKMAIFNSGKGKLNQLLTLVPP